MLKKYTSLCGILLGVLLSTLNSTEVKAQAIHRALYTTLVKTKPIQSRLLPPSQYRIAFTGDELTNRKTYVIPGAHIRVGEEYVYRPHFIFINPLVTREQLKAIMPWVRPNDLEKYYEVFNLMLHEYEINTPRRIGMFLAQVGHESGSWRYDTELASGAAYEWRKDLGNNQPGDGPRYKGRGLLQITGRHNYTVASKALGIDLVSNPELAADPLVSARIAGWYWQSRNLNALADNLDIEKVTRRINGGLNGYTDRINYYNRAKRVLAF